MSPIVASILTFTLSLALFWVIGRWRALGRPEARPPRASITLPVVLVSATAAGVSAWLTIEPVSPSIFPSVREIVLVLDGRACAALLHEARPRLADASLAERAAGLAGIDEHAARTRWRDGVSLRLSVGEHSPDESAFKRRLALWAVPAADLALAVAPGEYAPVERALYVMGELELADFLLAQPSLETRKQGLDLIDRLVATVTARLPRESLAAFATLASSRLRARHAAEPDPDLRASLLALLDHVMGR